MNTTTRLPFLLPLLGACLLAAPGLRAATYNWDPFTNRSNAAGSGPWDTTTAIWNNGMADVPWSANNDAVFGGADGAYTITVANGITANNATFNASGYTLTGASAAVPGSLTINSAGGLSVAAGKTLTVGANMTVGLSTYTTLAGTLNAVDGARLTGPQGQFFGGIVNVGAGSSVNYSSLLMSGTTVTVNGAGTSFTSLGSMSVSNSTVTITQGTFGTQVGNSGFSFSNSTVRLNGGTLLYGYGSGNNSGSTFYLNGGTIQTGSYPILLNGGTNSMIVQAGGAKIVGGSITISASLQHETAGPVLDGGLSKTGNGTLTLSAANTYTGGTSVGGGTLAASTNGALGTGDASVLAVSVSLSIGTGVTNPFNNVLGRLTLAGGGAAGTADAGYLDLTSGANIVVSRLTLGGTTYSAGVFTSALFPEYIAGTGTVTVVPEPGSFALVSALAVGLGATTRRIRRSRQD